jgi:hypothetical protein
MLRRVRRGVVWVSVRVPSPVREENGHCVRVDVAEFDLIAPFGSGGAGHQSAVFSYERNVGGQRDLVLGVYEHRGSDGLRAALGTQTNPNWQKDRFRHQPTASGDIGS